MYLFIFISSKTISIYIYYTLKYLDFLLLFFVLWLSCACYSRKSFYDLFKTRTTITFSYTRFSLNLVICLIHSLKLGPLSLLSSLVNYIIRSNLIDNIWTFHPQHILNHTNPRILSINSRSVSLWIFQANVKTTILKQVKAFQTWPKRL